MSRVALGYRAMYLSTPNIQHPVYNVPLGAQDAWVARVVELTKSHVESFRGSRSVGIFSDGFETASTEAWSAEIVEVP